MGNIKQWKGVAALLLFSIFLFNTSLSNTKAGKIDNLIMDNTVYRYGDASSNHCYFYISPSGNCMMEYEAVCNPENPGECNNAGHKFVSVITMADYNYLVHLLKVAISTGTSNMEPAEKCSGVIAVITGKSKKYPVDISSQTGRTIDSLVAGYKKKYTVATGKEALQQDTMTATGKITERFYVSKKGMVTDFKEYYFIPAGKELIKHGLKKEYFVKLWEGEIQREEVQKYTGKYIWIKGVFKKGFWDATGEQLASRVGDYVVIVEIMHL